MIKSLLDAGPAGSSKDDFEINSKHSDARKILKRLSDSDPDWASVISFPGSTGRVPPPLVPQTIPTCPHLPATNPHHAGVTVSNAGSAMQCIHGGKGSERTLTWMRAFGSAGDCKNDDDRSKGGERIAAH